MFWKHTLFCGMLKVVLIDDDVNDITTLENKLQQVANHIYILAKCNSVPEAVKAINRYQPDIVFCDIDMPGLNGLQLLDFFNEEEINFELIFVTNYSEYAVRAFQLSAIDYLLKPVDVQLLINAVNKVLRKQNLQTSERNMVLKKALSDNRFEKIALPLSSGLRFVEIRELVLLKADNVYTEIELQSKEKLLVSKPIKSFEKLLTAQHNFFRVHRSYLLNLKAVAEYIRTDGGSILLSTGNIVPIARERKTDFLQAWELVRVR